ncbi:hypothetical protein [Parapedobacter koreensis]|nr:hypothetical protein [Parapedobacter koreensis]
MNHNILAYFIYGLVTSYIIISVGRFCHRNGRVFILRLFQGNASLADTTNNLLLVAYCLFNIGYAIIQFSFWQPVANMNVLLYSIAEKTGLLVLILAVTHYFNIALIYWLSKRFIHAHIQTKTP